MGVAHLIQETCQTRLAAFNDLFWLNIVRKRFRLDLPQPR